MRRIPQRITAFVFGLLTLATAGNVAMADATAVLGTGRVAARTVMPPHVANKSRADR